MPLTEPSSPPSRAAASDDTALIESSVAAACGVGPGNPPRYEMGSAIGAGASATVLAATDRDLDREVAVKALPPGSDRASFADFIGEARLTASLQHPNVLPLYDLCLTNHGTPGFTMPRLRGRTLADIIDLDGTDLNRVVGVCLAVANAIAYAHTRGIVHQDIKPGNILVGDFGETVVLDWGSAARIGTEGRNTTKLYGTPLYMAPEQARREFSDARSDVYAIGATLFHALLRRPPMWTDDEASFWKRKASGSLDLPSREECRRVPAPLLAIALRALAADPASRYGSGAEIARELERFQAGQSVAAYREPLWRFLGRWYRHNRRLCWVAAAGLLAAGLLTALLAVESAKDRTRWQLVDSEDFAPGFDARWRMRSSSWVEAAATEHAVSEPSSLSRGDGFVEIHGRKDGFDDLSFARDIVGDVRVEWDYVPVSDANLNCFIDGADRLSGYTFHVGGWGDPADRQLTKGAEQHLATASGPAIVAGRSYHFRMERDGAHVGLAIDGTTVFDIEDATISGAQRAGSFGMDTCSGSTVRIAHVRIYQRPLSIRVSAVAVPQRLMDHGHFGEALAECESLRSAYRGTSIEPDLIYRIGRCQRLLGRADEAERTLGGFCERFPGHPLEAEVLRERWLIAHAAKDGARVDRIVEALGRFAGSAVATGVYAPLEADAESDIRQRPTTLDQPIMPPDEADRVRAAVRSLRARQALLGVAGFGSNFVHVARQALLVIGRADLILELFPDYPRECSLAHLERGELDQALRDAGDNGLEMRLALIAAGRYDEACQVREPDHLAALWAAGRIDELRAAPGGEFQYLRSTERFAEALPLATSDIDRGMLLIELGRYDEAMALPGHPPWFAQLCLLRRHDYDGLLAVAGSRDYQSLAVVEALAAGDPRFERLLDALRQAQADLHNLDSLFVRYVLPALIDHSRGAAAVPPASLAEALALPKGLAQQRLWYRVRYLLGQIDRAELAAQPRRHGLAVECDFCDGLRAELEDRPDDARAAYARVASAKPWTLALSGAERAYARFRAASGP